MPPEVRMAGTSWETLKRRARLAALAGALCLGLAQLVGATPRAARVAEALSELPLPPSGILLDRALPLVDPEPFDGSLGAPPVGLASWRQIYDQMWRASRELPRWPEPAELRQIAHLRMRTGVVPLAFMDLRYDRLRPEGFRDGALERVGGRLRSRDGRPFAERRLFAAAALCERTHHGERVVFELDPRRYACNTGSAPAVLDIDCDDGRGFRTVTLGDPVVVGYATPGRKLVRVRVTRLDGTVLHSSFPFEVVRLQTPAPHDTLQITASVPYAGLAGTGEAYVYLAPGHSLLERPVVVVEGFDLDNSMNWDELYTVLDQQGLIETLRAAGFDAVVLNFTEATDFIQRNAFVVAELVRQVQDAIDPGTEITLVGASMGGLVSRYALAFLETSGNPHRVRTFISFDGPQNGANIPLGMQYWLDFFAEQSADAAYLLGRLDTPAARQMLVYHHTTPPGATGESDPLRGELLADLAAVGGYPATPRRVAIANGSGSGADQGFAPGEQIVLWDYDTLLTDIVGDVWAVPAGTSQAIFDGLIRIFFVTIDQQTVAVSGTLPWDNAPGGWRASMAQMDSTAAPYGDIVALHPSHSFVPTVSALGIATSNPFYDIAGDADLLAHTPFDAVYFPAENQEHMTITPENAAWFLQEILAPTDAVTTPQPWTIALEPNFPNPFNPATTIRFDVPEPGPARLVIHDASGARVATLVDGPVAPGPTAVRWDGRDAAGRRVAAGVYFYRLEAAGRVLARKMTLLP